MRMFWHKDKDLVDTNKSNSEISSDKDGRITHQGTVLFTNDTMVIFNLVKESETEIQYKISKFPDGQQTIDIIDPTTKYQRHNPVRIKSRLNDFRDLELIICAVNVLRNIGFQTIELYVPYFLGSRSDRKFNEKGGLNYLKQVIGPVINSLNLNKVVVVDPHSDVLEACLNNFEKKDNYKLIEMALNNIDNEEGAQDRVMLISPDAGAYKKIFGVGETFGINDIVTCSKHRNIETGRIDSTEVPITKEQTEKSMVIIDDICDGGRSFVEIAKVIRDKQKEYDTNGKLYLVVSHGIFSKGFDELNQYFDGVFSTNSYSDVSDRSLQQLDIF